MVFFMKRTSLTKIAAGFAAVLVLSATAALPITASAAFCTAEQNEIERTAVTLTAAGNTSGTVNENAAGTANEPYNDANNANGSTAAGNNNTNNSSGNTAGDHRTDANDRYAENETGTGTEDYPGENIVDDVTDAVTGDEAAAANNNDNAANDTTAKNSGTNWASIIIALVIAVALIVVVLALIPRKRTD